jgi:Raf kinase inhibitor-like YbhB/YbcL family protein
VIGGGGRGGTGGTSGGGAATTGGGGASAGMSAAGSGGASAGAGGQGGSGGGSAGSGGQGGGGGGGGGGFTLTSSKLAPGATFAAEYTCASSSEHSPPLTWTAGPSGTLSYAIVLQDMTFPFTHWVVYDIPPTTTMLPESLAADATLTMPAGAKQKAGQGMGYLGPCPSGMLHTYVFTVYALDVATLPGVMASTSTMNLSAAIQMHDLASASLSGMSDATMP